MPILSVFAPLLKSHFFVIYYRCVTLEAGSESLWLQYRNTYGIMQPRKRGRFYDEDSLCLPWQDFPEF